MEPDLWRQWQAIAAQFATLGQFPERAVRGPQTSGGAFGPSQFLDSAERFAAQARSFMESSANASAASLAEAARRFGDFLRDQAAAAQPPWGAAFGIGNPNGAAAAAQWELPAMGATREHQQRAQRMAQAWARIEEAQRSLQRLWSDALREAAAAFATRVATLQPAAPSPEALNKLYDIWIDCAEDAYARMAHSDEFCAALADYANAGGQWRGEMQGAIEGWAKLLDLPTRSEINSLAKRLKSLEEQLRSAQKGREARPKPGRPPPKPVRPPPKSAASRPRSARRKAKK